MSYEEQEQRIVNQFKLICVQSLSLEFAINALQDEVERLNETKHFVQRQKQIYKAAVEGLEKFWKNIDDLSTNFYTQLTDGDIGSFDTIQHNANALQRVIYGWADASNDDIKQRQLELFLKDLQGDDEDFIAEDIKQKVKRDNYGAINQEENQCQGH